MTKEERIREIYNTRGRPDFYREYRWKSSFTQSVNTDLEKAIAEDNHGAFRIQIMKLNIPWRRVCESHSVYYLYSIKRAGKILHGLLKRGKEDRTEFNAWELLWNVLKEPNTAFEEVIRGFAEYPCLTHDEKAEMLRDAILVTGFLELVYNGNERSAEEIDKIHDLFEELFPGKNLFPERFGTWTDPRNGEVYGTVRLLNRVWLRTPLKYGMESDGLISEEAFRDVAKEIVPDGWRVPGDGDTAYICANPVSEIGDDGKITLFGSQESSKATCLAKDAPWPLLASDFAYVGDDSKKGGDAWNREIGMSGLDLRPTYGTGDSRESTVITFMFQSSRGEFRRMAWSLAGSRNYYPFYAPACREFPDRYDAKVYERACVLLCKDAPDYYDCCCNHQDGD